MRSDGDGGRRVSEADLDDDVGRGAGSLPSIPLEYI